METPADTRAAATGVVVRQEDRFGFVDQFRGVVILLFVVADITWNWSGTLRARGQGRVHHQRGRLHHAPVEARGET